MSKFVPLVIIPFLYRYEEIRFGHGVDEYDEPYPGYTLKIEVYKYLVVRQTPKGAWIQRFSVGLGSCLSNQRWNGESFVEDDDLRFVLLTANKRYACPDKNSALESFKYRKRRQVRILKGQIKQAEAALVLVEELQNPDKGRRYIQNSVSVYPDQHQQINLRG